MKQFTFSSTIGAALVLLAVGCLSGCTSPLPKPAPLAPSALSTNVSLDLGDGIKIEFVLIPAGTFTMGSITPHHEDEIPLHEVKFAKPFYMGRFVVTQEQWKKVMGADRSLSPDPKNPVNNISWNACQDFIAKLNYEAPRLKFSLPTEAQYEYACRAGTTNQYGTSDGTSNLDDIAWYKMNSRGTIHPVGEKQPNAWGLYDMQGDIYVWCQDVWQKTYEGAPVDGSARLEGADEYRVIRGGAWCYDETYLRTARRSFIHPDVHGILIGVRLVMTVTGPKAPTPILENDH